MRTYVGDLWDEAFDPPTWRVIPTNLGWTKDEYNVMGRGVARQAAERNGGLASFYGKWCKMMAGQTTHDLICFANPSLILLPTKGLNRNTPHLSWQAPSDIRLLERAVQMMAFNMINRPRNLVALPLLGCGNGGLDPRDVVPILHRHLDQQYVLVLTEELNLG